MTHTHSVHRKDTNHGAIVATFIKRGASVIDTFQTGNGFVDIVVGYKFFTVIVEIKHPGAQLRERQQKVKDNFKGAYAVIHTEDEASVVLRTIDAIHHVLAAASEGIAQTDTARWAILMLASKWDFDPTPVTKGDSNVPEVVPTVQEGNAVDVSVAREGSG
jgi:hypothetical protein